MNRLLICLMTSLLFIFIQSANGAACDVDDAVPTVWIGDEGDAYNKCNAELTSCELHGLEFVCEDPSGGELETCVNGTKVRCSSPPPVPLADPTPANVLRVIAYNIWELRYLVYQNGQRERTCRIPHELLRMHPDVDVIVFNEVFMGGCFSEFNSSIGSDVMTLRDLLSYNGFVHHTETVGNPPELPKLENGGVFIASRWPIVEEDSWVYNAAYNRSSDALAGKGAVYVKVEKVVEEVSMSYHVLGTHLQATGSDTAQKVRVAQATEMHDLMLRQAIPEGEPVIYAGDLNARNGTQHGFDVINALDATVPVIIGDRMYTMNGVENDLLTSTKQSWIDYALFSRAHLQPESATLEVVRPRSSEPFDVCMLGLAPVPISADSDRCQSSLPTRDLADHYAVMGVFKFETESSGSGADALNGQSIALSLILIMLSSVLC